MKNILGIFLSLLLVTVIIACNSSNSSDSTDETAEVTELEEVISTAIINDFLWKPQSERNGLLVILVNPVATTIVVTGTTMSETLIDSGPSNGRGTTGRSSFAGAAFGDGVMVEFFDATGARILVADGRRFVEIPVGASRLEFKL